MSMVLPPRAIVVALLTPFDAAGAVDKVALGAHVAWLIERGVDGFMPCGTTGETALLGDDEVVEVVESVVAACAGHVPVIAHVGRPATEATIALGERALTAGATAVSAVVPYYFRLDAEQVLAHYRALVGALGGERVLAYTIPSHAGNELDPATLADLAGAGLAGLKDSTQDPERHREYPRRHRCARGLRPPHRHVDAAARGAARRLRRCRAGDRQPASRGVRARARSAPGGCMDSSAAEAAQAELARAQADAPALPALKRRVAERVRADAGVAHGARSARTARSVSTRARHGHGAPMAGAALGGGPGRRGGDHRAGADLRWASRTSPPTCSSSTTPS